MKGSSLFAATLLAVLPAATSAAADLYAPRRDSPLEMAAERFREFEGKTKAAMEMNGEAAASAALMDLMTDLGAFRTGLIPQEELARRLENFVKAWNGIFGSRDPESCVRGMMTVSNRAASWAGQLAAEFNGSKIAECPEAKLLAAEGYPLPLDQVVDDLKAAQANHVDMEHRIAIGFVLYEMIKGGQVPMVAAAALHTKSLNMVVAGEEATRSQRDLPWEYALGTGKIEDALEIVAKSFTAPRERGYTYAPRIVGAYINLVLDVALRKGPPYPVKLERLSNRAVNAGIPVPQDPWIAVVSGDPTQFTQRTKLYVDLVVGKLDPWSLQPEVFQFGAFDKAVFDTRLGKKQSTLPYHLPETFAPKPVEDETGLSEIEQCYRKMATGHGNELLAIPERRRFVHRWVSPYFPQVIEEAKSGQSGTAAKVSAK